jgi:hypothetical protein
MGGHCVQFLSCESSRGWVEKAGGENPLLRRESFRYSLEIGEHGLFRLPPDAHITDMVLSQRLNIGGVVFSCIVLQGIPIGMGMGIDHSRDHGTTLQVHFDRVGSSHPEDPIVVPHPQNSTIPKSDSLGNMDGRLITIHGQNLAVVQNRIGVIKDFRR